MTSYSSVHDEATSGTSWAVAKPVSSALPEISPATSAFCFSRPSRQRAFVFCCVVAVNAFAELTTIRAIFSVFGGEGRRGHKTLGESC